MEQLASGYTLIEGPVWDPSQGLLFSDVRDGGVFCLESIGTVRPVVEHRRGIGGMALHESGGLIVGGRNIAYKGPAAHGTLVLIEQSVAPEDIIGFNDLTTDSAGRIYAGSLGGSPFAKGGIRRSGFLHMIDLDGSMCTPSHLMSNSPTVWGFHRMGKPYITAIPELASFVLTVSTQTVA